MPDRPPVLVSGAAGGIGVELSRALSAAGWPTVGLDLADGIDASDPRAVREFLQAAHVEVLSGVVTLAGRAGSGGIDETSIDEWRALIKDNLDTAYVVVRQALPMLRSAPGDRSIVLMSSVNGRTGGNSLSGPAYAVAKAGIIALMRHLARDLAGDGIRVNAVAPGPVETPMYRRLPPEQRTRLEREIPLGHTLSPVEVADAIVFLLSDAGRSITGAVLDMNGGMWSG